MTSGQLKDRAGILCSLHFPFKHTRVCTGKQTHYSFLKRQISYYHYKWPVLLKGLTQGKEIREKRCGLVDTKKKEQKSLYQLLECKLCRYPRGKMADLFLLCQGSVRLLNAHTRSVKRKLKGFGVKILSLILFKQIVDKCCDSIVFLI